MNGLPYYKAYPRDFFEGTRALPFEVKAAYRLLLDLIYMHGGSLEDEPRFIAGSLGCSVRAWNNYRRDLIAAGKITAENGIISNFRADKEIESSRSFQEKQRQNGRQPKQIKGLRQAVAEPKVNQPEPEPESYGGGGDTREPRDASQGQDATVREAILTAIGVDPVSGITGPSARMLGTRADMAEVNRWLDLPGITVPVMLEEVRRVMAGKRDGPPSSFRFFTKAMQRLSGDLSRPSLEPVTTGKGPRHDRERFDQTIAAVAAGLSSGAVGLGLEDRSPFAQRPGQDPEAGQHGAGALLRPGQ